MASPVSRERSPFLGGRTHLLIAILVGLALVCILQGCRMPSQKPLEDADTQPSLSFDSRICWVAYTPPSANPNRGIEATSEDILKDLTVLRQAHFTGLVTYSSSGRIGAELPELAQSVGFKGLIIGIWNPNNQREIAAAIAAARIRSFWATVWATKDLGNGTRSSN